MKSHNPALIESIKTGFNACFENDGVNNLTHEQHKSMANELLPIVTFAYAGNMEGTKDSMYNLHNKLSRRELKTAYDKANDMVWDWLTEYVNDIINKKTSRDYPIQEEKDFYN